MLEKKTVIVVGVGDGLGREVAKAVLRDGGNLVLAARTESVLEKTAKELDPSGEHVAYRPTDVTDAASCEALVALASERFGSVDAVILVAAFEAVFGGIHQTDLETWRKAYETNVIGAMQVVRAVAPAMKDGGGGSIVFIGSQSMFKPTMPQAGYAATKSALLTSMYYLVDELGVDNIRVNMVIPSWMWGPPVQGLIAHRAKSEGKSEEQVLEEIVGDFPMKRMAADEEVAEVAAFFASDRAKAISGQHLMVNCGELMR